MRKYLENEVFDTEIEPSDWRYSAAIVGLYKYLSYFGEKGEDFEITENSLKFHASDLTQEKYLQFVEHYYGEELPHRELERLLHQEAFSAEQCKLANELMKGNKILEKTFAKDKFDGTNQEEVLQIIEENRPVLIMETYRYKTSMYRNFANTGRLMKEGEDYCRLLGYDVDRGRKSNAISYNFDKHTFVARDDILFDFIPFAFIGDRESFFINDSFLVERLIETNRNFERFVEHESSENGKKDARKALFSAIREAADFLDYDVEVILKERDKDFFETMFIRKESIDILRKLENYKVFCFSLKVTDDYYRNIQKEVTECILNLIRTDALIELFLKRNSEYLVSQLIQLNLLICGGENKMRGKLKKAYECAKRVVDILPENKCASYRQKLTSAIIFKDYDRFIQVLFGLGNHLGTEFEFAYDLFDDFEKNKDIAYTFLNALSKEQDKELNMKQNDEQEEK